MKIVITGADKMTREEYIEKHIYTIAKIAGKRDDFQQVAIIGCLKAFDNSEDDPTETICNEIEIYLSARK